MAVQPVAIWMNVLGGQNSNHTDDLRQDSELLEGVTVQNLLPDPIGKLVTREGFSHVRAAAITGTTTIDGMAHMGDLADSFILVSNGKVWKDTASPPVEVTGGTALTAGSLARFDIFNSFLIIATQSRDVPQTINASLTRADLGGTPPYGIDVKSFGRRLHHFSPTYGGTTYRHRSMHSSANDAHATYTAPDTINFMNYGREGAKVNVLGGETYADHLMTFTEDSIFPVYTTPNATQPFAFQKDILTEDGGGPPVIHSVVKANDRLYWISKNSDVKELNGMYVRSVNTPLVVRSFLLGLNDAYRVKTIGFWEPKYRLVCWAVSDGVDTTNKDILAYHPDSKQFYFFTISVASAALRTVSGELRTVIGHHNGLFSYLFDGSTAGDLQAAASAIDALWTSPRMHHGMPEVVKKVQYMVFEFDPISTETVTIRRRYDDDTDYGSFPEGSTFTFSGTDHFRVYVTIDQPYKYIQVQVEDSTSGERFRLLRIGIPRPQVVQQVRS